MFWEQTKSVHPLIFVIHNNYVLQSNTLDIGWFSGHKRHSALILGFIWFHLDSSGLELDLNMAVTLSIFGQFLLNFIQTENVKLYHLCI